MQVVRVIPGSTFAGELQEAIQWQIDDQYKRGRKLAQISTNVVSFGVGQMTYTATIVFDDIDRDVAGS